MPKTLSRVVAIVGVVVGALAAVAGAVILWFMIQMLSAGDETRVSAYPKTLKEWSGLVDHFPRTIPSRAENVSLVAYPGAMQGSGQIQLRMRLPSDDVQAIEAQARADAVRRCPSQCTGAVEDPEYWHVPYLEAGEKAGGVRFPPDYVVYALETDGDWNHPSGRGIAVSVTRREVVYWAEE